MKVSCGQMCSARRAQFQDLWPLEFFSMKAVLLEIYHVCTQVQSLCYCRMKQFFKNSSILIKLVWWLKVSKHEVKYYRVLWHQSSHVPASLIFITSSCTANLCQQERHISEGKRTCQGQEVEDLLSKLSIVTRVRRIIVFLYSTHNRQHTETHSRSFGSFKDLTLVNKNAVFEEKQIHYCCRIAKCAF